MLVPGGRGGTLRGKWAIVGTSPDAAPAGPAPALVGFGGSMMHLAVPATWTRLYGGGTPGKAVRRSCALLVGARAGTRFRLALSGGEFAQSGVLRPLSEAGPVCVSGE
jgi:hypothetical protein